MQHLRPHPVNDTERGLGPVLRRIDVDPEWAFAEGRVNGFNDGFRHRTRIRVGWNDGSKGFLDFLPIIPVRPRLILGCALRVGRRAGMREVVGAAGEGARHDDRSFDAPERKLTGVLHGQGVMSENSNEALQL